MRLLRPTAIVAMFGLLLASSGGCLSLSMLNRDNSDTRQRLDSLERRVSALEAGGVQHPGQAIVVPDPSQQFPQVAPFGEPSGRR